MTSDGGLISPRMPLVCLVATVIFLNKCVYCAENQTDAARLYVSIDEVVMAIHGDFAVSFAPEEERPRICQTLGVLTKQAVLACESLGLKYRCNCTINGPLQMDTEMHTW